MSMTRVSRAQQRRDTRLRIFGAALEIFRRDGVEGARIDEIAELAGVSRGAFYFHFPTKDDVLAELLREAEERVAHAVEMLPARAPVLSILEALAAAVMERWQNEPTLFPAVGMLALRLTASGKLTHESDVVRAAVARRFASAAKRGELTKLLPPGQLADMFLAGAFAALRGSTQPAAPVDQVLRRIARVFLDGARAGSR